MNKKQLKMIAVVTGLAVSAGAISLTFTPAEAAKWLTMEQNSVTEKASVPEPKALVVPVDAPAVQLTSEQAVVTSVMSKADEVQAAVTTAKPVVVLKEDSVRQVFGEKVIKIPVSASTNFGKKVVVTPGVEGLDYAKVIRWQQNVDAGQERWRLDPLQVAKKEGKSYGFTDKDTFTVVKRLERSELAANGEIHVKVKHDNKDYIMILVKPFGGGDAIWTTYRVIGAKTPVPAPAPEPVGGKVLFSSDKYADWKWYKRGYLEDMAFATVVDYKSQLEYDKRIPETVLAKVKDADFKNKVILFAYLGTAPSGGYGIGIEKVSISGNKATVVVHTRSPQPGAPVTLAITQPADYVAIDRAVFDIWGGVDLTFVDQNGKVLSKNKLTIVHR